MCVLIFCTNPVWNISHSKQNRARYNQHCMSVFLWSAGFSCQILMKLEFWHIFEKYSHTKFNENPSNWSRVVSWGQTAGRPDMTKLILTFHNFANVPKNVIHLHAMKERGLVCVFLTSILVKVWVQVNAGAGFTPRWSAAGTRWTWGCVGLCAVIWNTLLCYVSQT